MPQHTYLLVVTRDHFFRTVQASQGNSELGSQPLQLTFFPSQAQVDSFFTARRQASGQASAQASALFDFTPVSPEKKARKGAAKGAGGEGTQGVKVRKSARGRDDGNDDEDSLPLVVTQKTRGRAGQGKASGSGTTGKGAPKVTGKRKETAKPSAKATRAKTKVPKLVVDEEDEEDMEEEEDSE